MVILMDNMRALMKGTKRAVRLVMHLGLLLVGYLVLKMVMLSVSYLALMMVASMD